LTPKTGGGLGEFSKRDPTQKGGAAGKGVGRLRKNIPAAARRGSWGNFARCGVFILQRPIIVYKTS
jgi:hypothetical protein